MLQLVFCQCQACGHSSSDNLRGGGSFYRWKTGSELRARVSETSSVQCWMKPLPTTHCREWRRAPCAGRGCSPARALGACTPASAPWITGSVVLQAQKPALDSCAGIQALWPEVVLEQISWPEIGLFSSDHVEKLFNKLQRQAGKLRCGYMNRGSFCVWSLFFTISEKLWFHLANAMRVYHLSGLRMVMGVSQKWLETDWRKTGDTLDHWVRGRRGTEGLGSKCRRCPWAP